ncbi:primosomal protein [Ornithinimicrobium sp. INDO-MA30-4]|uniref:primosomal protein n=1 Tax=Ornithinimicrobium sp. INDO-MA30-4 TaxID=2908651 RepID=UPI001F1C5942|nr:primosomal protein [Ornithinimicrobium sp. INDO-MA30-4]UJH71064.1 primosomal protein [Ornithinimicrobium sp. INDO-MA30-4]
MNSEPRAALLELVAALEAHLTLAEQEVGEHSPDLLSAYQRIADTFMTYDDALLSAFGEVTPLDIYSEDDDDGEFDDDDVELVDPDDLGPDDLDDNLDDDVEDEETEEDKTQ